MAQKQSRLSPKLQEHEMMESKGLTIKICPFIIEVIEELSHQVLKLEKWIQIIEYVQLYS